MSLARTGTATLLPDGRVLIYGGTSGSGQPQAEVYDPTTRTFAAADQMMTSLGGHPVVMLPGAKLLFLDGILLQDGRVFFATEFSQTSSYAEIYDPMSGGFSQLGYDPQTTLSFHWNTATLLLDGRVLLTGAEGTAGQLTQSASKLFDPRTNCASPMEECSSPAAKSRAATAPTQRFSIRLDLARWSRDRR
jgi:hypothetical protein